MLRKAVFALEAFGVVGLTAVVEAKILVQNVPVDRFGIPSITRRVESNQVLAQNETSRPTESILRKTIQDMQQGNPDYESMEPDLQKAVRAQSAATADIYRHLGSLKTLTYVSTQNGVDLYKANYQNAAAIYTIQLSASGKISGLRLQPAFPW